MRPVLLLICALTLSACGGTSDSERVYRITAYVPSSIEVPIGSDVRIGGVSVGSVVDTSSASDQLEVTLEIQPEYAPIDEGAEAAVRQKTLLGDVYVELTNTATPDAADTEPNSDTEAIFDSLDPDAKRAFEEWQEAAAD